MPSKRQILDLLNRRELQVIADAYALEVSERRVKDQLVDAAAGSRKVVRTDVLAVYSRDRLKDLCRDLELDDSGKEKSVLVGRLASQAPPPAQKVLVLQTATVEAPKQTTTNRHAKTQKRYGLTGGDLGFEQKLWRAAGLVQEV